MRKLIPITLMLLVLLAPVAFAHSWEAVCIGDVLVQNITVTADGDIIPVETNITCPYGCDAGRRHCTDYSGPPGTALPLSLFIIMELLAVGALIVSFISDDSIAKLITSLVALILLFSLALLANNIMTAQGAIQIEWLGWLNIGLAWIGVIMFLVSIFFVLKERMADKLPV